MSQKIRFLFQFLPFLNTSKETAEYTFVTPLPPSLEFLELSLYPKKFQRKQAFTPGNSAKLYDTPCKFQGQKTHDLSCT